MPLFGSRSAKSQQRARGLAMKWYSFSAAEFETCPDAAETAEPVPMGGEGGCRDEVERRGESMADVRFEEVEGLSEAGEAT